ncbi:MAG: SirB2 family protein [Betaproteobacteria bacterium]|nr:SirB2 family protein [Betaproteobacteria bacterium]MDH5221675.1 SirB2 family protein [Betaproteobacteria bacterium]MDH5351574.1 SirB2 family protein [Betaproteobacteria bacterium]
MAAAEAYLCVRTLHTACAVVSIAGFAARGALMLAGSPLLQHRLVRIAPHVIDTLLLASAVWLAWFLGQVPFVHGWITAKVLALLAYIVLGTIALKRGRTKRVRGAAFAAALATAAYIVAVALTRDATPWS